MPIPLSIPIYQRGANGVPDTTTIGIDLSSRVDSYQHTITDQLGFESMSVSLTVSLEEALDWLSNGLMRSTIVSSPDGEVVWEGYLNEVSAKIGQKTATLSLDAMANRVRCTYTTVLGTPGTSSSTSSAASQALYGIKDRVVALNDSNATAAGYRAAIVLADLAFPKSQQATQAATGAQGDIQLTLSFVGWYTALDWLITSSGATSTAVTTTQVGTLLTNYAGVNNFFPTSTYYFTASGISSPQFIAANSTYRQAIEERLKLGTGTNPITWGMYEDRFLHVDPWAGATPTTITYYEHLGSSDVFDSAGNPVAPWDVRPNAMSEVVELLDIGPPSSAPDAAARKYVGRVTCSIQGDQIGCTLEPSATDSIDVRLAALR